MDHENQGGRPSSYDPKYCAEIIEYFSVEPYVEKMKKIVTKAGDVVEIPALEASDFPSFAGFAVKIDKDRGTLLNWCESHPEFFGAYKKAKELQENWMLVNGMRGHVEVAFAIFTAKNVLGYRDRQPGEADVVINQIIAKKSDDEIDARLVALGYDPKLLEKQNGE